MYMESDNPWVGFVKIEAIMSNRMHGARKSKQLKNDEVIFSAVNKIVQDILDRESLKKAIDSQIDIFSKLIK